MFVFHESMINHLLTSGNIFKYDWLDFWNQFSEENELVVQGHEFRKEMVEKILPNIYSFALTERQKQILVLLRYDMFLNENEKGFNLVVPRNHVERIKIIVERLQSWVS